MFQNSVSYWATLVDLEETRRETKKIRRRDKGQKKKWGDEMRDEKKMERQDLGRS